MRAVPGDAMGSPRAVFGVDFDGRRKEKSKKTDRHYGDRRVASSYL
jgi:hypothetical protein